MSAAPTRPRAVALLSGGMDSATAAAIVRDEGHDVFPLVVDYGQRHRAEIRAALAVAAALRLEEPRVLRVDLAALGGSALTDDLDVPKDRPDAEIGASIPVTYVPARNTVLLAVAAAAAEALDAEAIVIGVNAVDSSGYPDCRPAFLDAFARVVAVGTRRGVEGRPPRVLAPLLHATKAEVVRRGLAHGVPFALTLSCYDPEGPEDRPRPCRRCDACRLRARGFAEAGIPDPAAVARGP
jgi:7-cyano-7-deazaguanine synthase